MNEWLENEKKEWTETGERRRKATKKKKKERGKIKTGLKCSTSKKEEMNWKSKLNKDETEVNKGSES